MLDKDQKQRKMGGCNVMSTNLTFMMVIVEGVLTLMINLVGTLMVFMRDSKLQHKHVGWLMIAVGLKCNVEKPEECSLMGLLYKRRISLTMEFIGGKAIGVSTMNLIEDNIDGSWVRLWCNILCF